MKQVIWGILIALVCVFCSVALGDNSKQKQKEEPNTLPLNAKAAESFIESYKAAHAKKDIELLAKLVYWEGVPEILRAYWKEETAKTFEYPIKSIELKDAPESFKARKGNLPCTHTLVIIYDINEAVPGGRKTGSKTVESAVGKKGEEFFFVMPKQEKDK
jgi:hypothetical protein